MQNIESPKPATNTFTVVTWNILLDKTRSSQTRRDSGAWDYIQPQDERLPSQIETLRGLGVDLDVVAIQEAHETKAQHNGVKLASELGFAASYWAEHNISKRKGERIGMFGNLVDGAETIELGYDKKAVITIIGGVAVATMHARREYWGSQRAEQMAVLANHLDGYDHAAIVGDANALFFEKSRRLLYGEGFHSAFRLAGERRPVTFPTPAYRRIMLGLSGDATSWQDTLLRNGVSLDIIYVRGMDVSAADRFMGDSDHYGLWATIKPRR